MGNLALCYLKQDNFERAEYYCTKRLDKVPDDLKVILRRGVARKHLSNYEGALQDMKLA